jgi:hypothetical protein
VCIHSCIHNRCHCVNPRPYATIPFTETVHEDAKTATRKIGPQTEQSDAGGRKGASESPYVRKERARSCVLSAGGVGEGACTWYAHKHKKSIILLFSAGHGHGGQALVTHNQGLWAISAMVAVWSPTKRPFIATQRPYHAAKSTTCGPPAPGKQKRLHQAHRRRA